MIGHPSGYRGRDRIIVTISRGLIFRQEIPPKNRLKTQRRGVAKKSGYLQVPEIFQVTSKLMFLFQADIFLYFFTTETEKGQVTF
jgi:hypothetical protein